MQPQLSRACLWLIAPLLLAVPLRAQSWDALRNLNPGDQIKVQATGSPEYKGRFQSASADAISIETGHGVVSVERARVRQVQVRSSARRARRIAIAAAIGLAIGVTADQTVGRYIRNESGEDGGARALTYIAPTAIFGAIAGAFPSYRTIYRVR